MPSDRMGLDEIYWFICTEKDSSLVKKYMYSKISELKFFMEAFDIGKLSVVPPGYFVEIYRECLAYLPAISDRLKFQHNFDVEEYARIFEWIGYEVFYADGKFEPILHEMNELRLDSNSSGVSVDRCLWPGLRLGECVVSRSICDVVASPNYGYIPGITNKSMVHFADIRKHRKVDGFTFDTWRTNPCRNYIVEDYLLFNVDGYLDLGKKEDEEEVGYPISEMRQLIYHGHTVAMESEPEGGFPASAYRMAVLNKGLEKCSDLDSLIVPFEVAWPVL